ncbi:MAG: rod shape-determining protein [Candidatus Portnoybacteria bacterium]|nr:rod shape-determining protein [Candidatus Portnoybacteria bacterium]
MLEKFFGKISKDLGVDLGTANTLVYIKGRGIVINQPSVVALNQKTGQILAIGNEAKKMVGRTPGHIIASRPLTEGVISDFEIAEQMLRYFISQIYQQSFKFLARPRVVVGVPSGVTEVEKRAVEDATRNAGAKEVYLIEEPMAAAIGARLPVQEACGNMIVDIGGGTSEVAIISLGGIVVCRSLRLAGDNLNQDIIQYARDEFKLLLGEKTAEDIKIAIGSVCPLEDKMETTMRGRDLLTGLPKEVIVNSDQIREAMRRSIKTLVNAIRSTVEEAPPELVADIMTRGIILSGGGSLIRGLDKLVAEETRMPVKIADDPLTAVVRGCGVVLEDLDGLRNVLATSQFKI